MTSEVLFHVRLDEDTPPRLGYILRADGEHIILMDEHRNILSRIELPYISDLLKDALFEAKNPSIIIRNRKAILLAGFKHAELE